MRCFVLTDADYALLAAIDRHGPLPSSYLFEFTRHLRRDRTHLQNRLTEFYNGDDRGRLLTRPQQQFAAYAARYQHLVYDLSPRARFLLAERGLLEAPTRSDPFVHRLMCACVGASFELSAPLHRLRYLSSGEILQRASGDRFRDAARSLPIAVPGQGAIIPDLLFGLEYPGAGYRFFAVECDRNTESIERRNLSQSAFARKLAGYSAILATDTHRSEWGVPNLHILTITTSIVHARAILAAVRKHVEPRYQPVFALAVEPSFGADWRVPATPLAHLLDGAWRTTDGERNFSQA